MSVNLDVVSLSSVSGYGSQGLGAPVPTPDTSVSGQTNKAAEDKGKEDRFSSAFKITLSEEAKALIARMEGAVRQPGDVRFEDLSAEEQSRVRSLEQQLSQIYGTLPNRKLDEEQKAAVGEIHVELNELLGFRPKVIDPSHHTLVQRLEQEADRLLSDPAKLLSETEERQLAVIYSHLESLQGVSSVSYQTPEHLSEEVASLQSRLDQIYGISEIKLPNSDEMKQATQIFKDLAGIYDGAFKRMMKLDGPE
ncbi:hypothetical protein [Kiloniella laminariae]|uniref:hypothetical protein n=1 Tax=Kiloniella laminariae TaxID=454162 RepID=UPI0003806C07|nr:hypothetical protein [Kiloniella laminariae]